MRPSTGGVVVHNHYISLVPNAYGMTASTVVAMMPGAQMAPHEVPLKTAQWDPDAQQQSWVESGE